MRKNAEVNYELLFFEYINSGKSIRTADGSQFLEMQDGEEWRLCYDPENKARRVLPKNWLLSDRGNLVSVTKKGKVRLIKKSFNGSKYASHYFVIREGDIIRHRRISLHNLIAVVFGSDAYGRAAGLLKEFGLDAFGSLGDKDKLNGHHKIKASVARDLCSPDNIRILTTEAHQLENIPKDSADRAKVFAYMRKCAAVAADESPKGITVISTGQRLNKDSYAMVSDHRYMDIESVERIAYTPEAYRSLITLHKKAVNRWIVERCTEQLQKQFGLEWFQENRFFATKYGFFYECKYAADGLRIAEVLDSMRLNNVSLITCYINGKKQAECLIPQES